MQSHLKVITFYLILYIFPNPVLKSKLLWIYDADIFIIIKVENFEIEMATNKIYIRNKLIRVSLHLSLYFL